MAFEERKCDVSLVRGKCVTLAQDIGIYDENKRICSEYKKVSGEKKVKQPTLEDWLWVEVMLLQATIGSISQNVRQIALCYLEGNWVIDVVLEQDSLEDREEIKYIEEDTNDYIEGINDKLSDCAYTGVYSNVQVSKEELNFEESPWEARLTFKRKERYKHVGGTPEYGGGGYLNSIDDAQQVLDAYHSGAAKIIGKTDRDGFPVIRYDGVTGFNVNTGSGYKYQPTNVFFIKGTSSPVVVPTNPNWGQKE